MTKPAFRSLRGLILGIAGVVLAQACSSSADIPHGRAGFGGMTSNSGTGGVSVIMPDGGPPPLEGGASGISPLCGVGFSGCDPDHVLSCANYVANSSKLELGQSGAGGAAGNAGGGAGGESGSTTRPSGDAAAGGGAGGSAGATSSAGAGGTGGAGMPDYACRVTRIDNNTPLSVCAPSGDGGIDAPCFSGSDCTAGLACARYRNVARCRPYCCHGDDACSPGTYCTEQPLVDDSIPSTVSSLLVPVCAPADSCDLEEPFPCPTDRVCQCPSGKACLVVRNDGTTTCETPGMGELGDTCPCKYGYVCSRATGVGVCQQLCSISNESSLPRCTGGGRCQVSSELPAGFGVCVGG
ncbi:MAG: hypothetical protein ACOY0T_08560 [Myxococcota bacterium]